MFLLLRFARRIISAVIGISVLAVAISMTSVVHLSTLQETGPADAILVFGAAQFDGDPSPVLRNRLDHAYDLYAQDVATRIVTVGGKQPGDRFTEAESGRAYLHARGVAYSHLKAIKAGRDTYTSAQAVAAWAKRSGIHAVLVVTDRAHMARAVTIVQYFGITASASSPQQGAGSAMSRQYVWRETLGLLRFWFFKDGNPLTTVRNAFNNRPKASA